MKRIFRISSACVSSLLAMHCFAAPTQEEVDAAKRTQALAEAEKATADANKAKAEAENAEARAKLGTLDLSKLSKTSGEAKGLTVEGNLLAYAAIDRVSTAIAKQLSPRLAGKPIVIFTEKELRALGLSQSFSFNLQTLDKALVQFKVPTVAADDAKCASPEAGGGVGPLGVIDIAAQVLSVFKVDKKLEGTDVTVDSFALAASVLSKLQEAGVQRAIYPPLYMAGPFAKGKDVTAESKIAKLLSDVTLHARLADDRLADLAKRREKLKARIDGDKKPTPECKNAYAEAQAIYDNVEATGKALKSRSEKFIAAATTPDEKTGETLLQGLVAAESMAATATDGYVLQLKPISAGGATLTKTSFFTTSFRFSGGAIVSYMLVSGVDGTVISSGTIGDYGGYIEPEDLRSVLQVQR